MSFLSIRIITFKVLLLKRRSSVPVVEDFLKKIHNKQESKALIFSLNKIQQARDLFIEKNR